MKFSSQPQLRRFITMPLPGCRLSSDSVRGGSTTKLLATYSLNGTTLTITLGTGGNRPDGQGTDETQIQVILIQP